MLSLLLDSIVIPQLRFNKVNTDECDVNLNDGKKDIEVAKINAILKLLVCRYMHKNSVSYRYTGILPVNRGVYLLSYLL